jgi:hypothetical protein
VALDDFLVVSLCLNEDRQSSSSDSKVNKHCSIGAVSGNSSMVVSNVGISHSIGMVASIPWMRWNIVKPVAFMGDMR